MGVSSSRQEPAGSAATSTVKVAGASASWLAPANDVADLSSEPAIGTLEGRNDHHLRCEFLLRAGRREREDTEHAKRAKQHRMYKLLE